MRTWRRWTQDEDDLIRKYYPDKGAAWGGWARLMPDRLPTRQDVAQRACRLGVRCRHKFRYGKGVER